MGNFATRQASRSIYHDPSIRRALQLRGFATATTGFIKGTGSGLRPAQKKAQAPDPQLRVALQQRYGELTLQKKPQDRGKVRQLVASTGAVYRAPACDPWARGQLFR